MTPENFQSSPVTLLKSDLKPPAYIKHPASIWGWACIGSFTASLTV